MMARCCLACLLLCALSVVRGQGSEEVFACPEGYLTGMDGTCLDPALMADPATEKRAYVTLDAVPGLMDFWKGVLVWAESLRAHGLPDNTDLVVLVLEPGKGRRRDPNFKPEVVARYERAGLKVKFVQPFPMPPDQGGSWRLPWHKLNAWQLVQYDTVVYMDADSIILQPGMEQLFRGLDLGAEFTAAGFACTATGCGQTPATKYEDMTSGIFALKPDWSMFGALVEFATESSEWGGGARIAKSAAQSDGKFRNDQRFLAEFFHRRQTAAWIEEAQVYHANVASCGNACGGVTEWPAKRVDFGCAGKPWRWTVDGRKEENAKRQREGMRPLPDEAECQVAVFQLWNKYLADAMAKTSAKSEV